MSGMEEYEEQQRPLAPIAPESDQQHEQRHDDHSDEHANIPEHNKANSPHRLTDDSSNVVGAAAVKRPRLE